MQLNHEPRTAKLRGSELNSEDYRDREKDVEALKAQPAFQEFAPCEIE